MIPVGSPRYVPQREATSSLPLLLRGGASGPGRPGASEGVPVMAWTMLFFAGILEIVWATAMKLSAGFTRPLPALVTLVAMIASFTLLALAMRQLPLGTAYMVWTGIGAVGAFVVGIVMLGEGVSAMRLLAAALIVSGIALMKLASP